MCTFDPENDWWCGEGIYKADKGTVMAAAWHPNSQIVATGSGRKVCRVFSAYVEETDDTYVALCPTTHHRRAMVHWTLRIHVWLGVLFSAPTPPSPLPLVFCFVLEVGSRASCFGGHALSHEAGPFTVGEEFGCNLIDVAADGWVEAVAWSPDGCVRAIASHGTNARRPSVCVLCAAQCITKNACVPVLCRFCSHPHTASPLRSLPMTRRPTSFRSPTRRQTPRPSSSPSRSACDHTQTSCSSPTTPSSLLVMK